MILREIYVKDNSVRRYDNLIVGLSSIGVSSTFDSEITYITNSDNKKVDRYSGSLTVLTCIGVSHSFESDIIYIRDYKTIVNLVENENLFGVCRTWYNHNDLYVQIYVLKQEEIKLLNYIDDFTLLYSEFPKNVSYYSCRRLPKEKYRFLLKDYFDVNVYFSILELLLYSDFKLEDSGFYIKPTEVELDTDITGIYYKLNCSESEFKRFLTKVTVLKK